MNKTILYSLVAIIASGSFATADAKSKWKDRDHHDRHDRYDRHDRHDHDRYSHRSHRTRTIYVIQNNRPVRRVVYVHPSGYYYNVVSGRPVRIRDRHYTSYPSRYYYSDGRPRVGISLNF